MDIFDYDVIREIYDDLKKEQKKYREDLQQRKEKIKKIDEYLNGLLNRDENDAQVFLARKIENLYREDIDRNRREKEKISAECDCLEEYLHTLNINIDKLRKVLFNNNQSMLHVKHLLVPSSIDLLNDVIQKINSVSNRMADSSKQLKADLKDIKKKIYIVIENLKNT